MQYLPLDSHLKLYFIQTGGSALSNTYAIVLCVGRSFYYVGELGSVWYCI